MVIVHQSGKFAPWLSTNDLEKLLLDEIHARSEKLQRRHFCMHAIYVCELHRRIQGFRVHLHFFSNTNLKTCLIDFRSTYIL